MKLDRPLALVRLARTLAMGCVLLAAIPISTVAAGNPSADARKTLIAFVSGLSALELSSGTRPADLAKVLGKKLNFKYPCGESAEDRACLLSRKDGPAFMLSISSWSIGGGGKTIGISLFRISDLGTLPPDWYVGAVESAIGKPSGVTNEGKAAWIVGSGVFRIRASTFSFIWKHGADPRNQVESPSEPRMPFYHDLTSSLVTLCIPGADRDPEAIVADAFRAGYPFRMRLRANLEFRSCYTERVGGAAKPGVIVSFADAESGDPEGRPDFLMVQVAYDEKAPPSKATTLSVATELLAKLGIATPAGSLDTLTDRSVVDLGNFRLGADWGVEGRVRWHSVIVWRRVMVLE